MNGVNYEPLIRDMTWSFSRLSAYDQCQHMWWLHYLMEAPEEEQFYASFGSFCHELIAQYYTGELAREELLPAFLQGFCDRVRGERPSREIEQKYLDQGAFYFEHFESFPLTTELVEKPISISFNDGGEHPVSFTGIMDYLGRNADGRLVIVDHKSADLKPYSKRYADKPTQSDLKLDGTFRQLYLYAEWVAEAYGEFPAELWLNCFRTGKLIKSAFDSNKLQEAKDWMNRQIGRIAKEDLFIPNDDYYYCRWVCGQHNNCELYEEEYTAGRRYR